MLAAGWRTIDAALVTVSINSEECEDEEEVNNLYKILCWEVGAISFKI